MEEKNNNNIIIKIFGISKRFGGTQALKDINFELKRGEVHAIVGENGAGKTTLVNILHGIIKNDSGSIIIKGKRYASINPSIAKKVGITVIPQKVQLVSSLSIEENLFFNNWPRLKFFNLVNWPEMRRLSRKLLEKLELSLDPFKKIKDLSYIDKQIIQITRALFIDNADIIILDEPTAALVDHEINILFDFIKSLRDKGTSFIYISHYLNEVFKICDKVTILRDGEVVTTKEVKKLTMEKLVKSMVGINVDLFPDRNTSLAGDILEVKNFAKKPLLRNVNFNLRKGEILGISGLKGSGRTELCRSICGLDRFDSGELIYKGKKIRVNSTRKGLDIGIGYLPDDRIKWGIALMRPIRENITITFLKKIINKIGFIRLKKEEEIVDYYIDKLNIKASSINQSVNYLSGGNQQKVIISKLLGANLDVLIFDDPTFGVDVKVKMNIHKIMNEIVDKGGSIILVSSDNAELIGMCDRIIILKNGEIVEEYLKDKISETMLLKIIEER